MSWVDEVSSVLKQCVGASASSPGANAAADFGKIAEQAPASAVSGGLSEAFRSESTPPFGEMIAQLFEQSDATQRAGILNHLIAAAGPVAAAGGPLGKLAELLPGSGVTPDQARQVSPEAVRQLAEGAQKRDPSIIDKASAFYAEHPTLVKALGASALALIMSHMSQRR